MQEATLLKASLVTALLGLCVLLFLSGQFRQHPEAYPDAVWINGTVARVYASENLTLVDLVVEEPMTVAVFDDLEFTPQPGMRLSIIGQKEIYKGEEQITATRVLLQETHASGSAYTGR